jgi:hypothetical protein
MRVRHHRAIRIQAQEFALILLRTLQTAWFELRDPGRYLFTCPAGNGGAQAELNCPLQPLARTKGGLRNMLQVGLSL